MPKTISLHKIGHKLKFKSKKDAMTYIKNALWDEKKVYDQQ